MGGGDGLEERRPRACISPQPRVWAGGRVTGGNREWGRSWTGGFRLELL